MISRHDNYYTQCTTLRKGYSDCSGSSCAQYEGIYAKKEDCKLIEFQLHACDEERNDFQIIHVYFDGNYYTKCS